MPEVRKLSIEEVEQLRRRGARVDLAPYLAELSELEIGDWGLVELEDGDKAPTIKRRYTVAAKEQGKYLAYKRLRKSTIPFEVKAASDEPAKQRRPARAPKAET